MPLAPERIARLDRQLAKKGETVIVRRRIGTAVNTFASISARARLTGYSGAEVGGDVRVTDRRFVMSPTAFTSAPNWKAAAEPPAGPTFPRIGDFMVYGDGTQRMIEQVEHVKVGDAVVRIEGRVR